MVDIGARDHSTGSPKSPSHFEVTVQTISDKGLNVVDVLLLHLPSSRSALTLLILRRPKPCSHQRRGFRLFLSWTFQVGRSKREYAVLPSSLSCMCILDFVSKSFGQMLVDALSCRFIRPIVTSHHQPAASSSNASRIVSRTDVMTKASFRNHPGRDR